MNSTTSSRTMSRSSSNGDQLNGKASQNYYFPESQKEVKCVTWSSCTIDNEHMNKRSLKASRYPPSSALDTSSEDDDDGSDHEAEQTRGGSFCNRRTRDSTNPTTTVHREKHGTCHYGKEDEAYRKCARTGLTRTHVCFHREEGKDI
jgi:hypothetical protein